MGSFALSIITGLFGGFANAYASHISDDQAWEELQYQQFLLEDTYKLDKEKAEIDFQQAKEEAERNAKQSELQADLTDKNLNITEQGLSQDFNTYIDNLYMSQEADSMNWNLAAMQAGSSEGAAYSQLAGSGVRAGSSLSDAVLMESAVNENQLQFSQDQKRRSDDNNLASVLSNLAGNKVNIQSNRIGADVTRENAAYLRNSYLEGGYNYNLYQNQLKMMETKYQYNIDQIKREMEKHSGSNANINAIAAFFNGASQGASAGYNFGESLYKANKYKTSLGED